MNRRRLELSWLQQFIACIYCKILLLEPMYFSFKEPMITFSLQFAFLIHVDVLKRVSFNPKMGEMLTFNGNRAVQYEWNNDLMPEYGRNPEVDGRTLVYPDENYAREIMQVSKVAVNSGRKTFSCTWLDTWGRTKCIRVYKMF